MHLKHVFCLVFTESERKVITMAQQLHTGSRLGFGFGALLFRGIPHQQSAESCAVRRNVQAYSKERRGHRNRSSRSSTGYTQKILNRYGQYSNDTTRVWRLR